MPNDGIGVRKGAYFKFFEKQCLEGRSGPRERGRRGTEKRISAIKRLPAEASGPRARTPRVTARRVLRMRRVCVLEQLRVRCVLC